MIRTLRGISSSFIILACMVAQAQEKVSTHLSSNGQDTLVVKSSWKSDEFEIKKQDGSKDKRTVKYIIAKAYIQNEVGEEELVLEMPGLTRVESVYIGKSVNTDRRELKVSIVYRGGNGGLHFLSANRYPDIPTTAFPRVPTNGNWITTTDDARGYFNELNSANIKIDSIEWFNSKAFRIQYASPGLASRVYAEIDGKVVWLRDFKYALPK